MHILINKNYLTFNNYKAKCAIGKRGIGLKRTEGDLITPKGKFKFKSKLKKIAIEKNMGWCDDPRSKKYNKLIRLPSSYSFEKLYKKENIYDIVLVLNYNMNPVIKNKGSAIFIHISKKKYKKTEGCVAIKKIHLLKIIEKLTNTTKVMIENQK